MTRDTSLVFLPSTPAASIPTAEEIAAGIDLTTYLALDPASPPETEPLVFHYNPGPEPARPADLQPGHTIHIELDPGEWVTVTITGPRVPGETPDEFSFPVRRPKAADITDEMFMAALDPDGAWTSWSTLCERLRFPDRVVLAKARTLIKRRGTLHGCDCGCRGDFHRADECKGC